jgi:hypothetical protein
MFGTPPVDNQTITVVIPLLDRERRWPGGISVNKQLPGDRAIPVPSFKQQPGCNLIRLKTIIIRPFFSVDPAYSNVLQIYIIL